MEKHELDITISPNGEVKVHIKGVKGPACLEYAKIFEKILGEASDVEHTHEYYEPPTEVEIQVEQDT
ncbi:MAG: DUF2997 domain-containing protein [Planctomycetes bacterium]|nr:DUF2997 domain-containing protein [Planctomycetota bacterium]